MVTRVMEGARQERNEKRLPPSFLGGFATRRSRARTTLTKSEEKTTARSLVEICLIFISYLTLFFFPET